MGGCPTGVGRAGKKCYRTAPNSGVKLGRVWGGDLGKWILRVFCVLGRVADENSGIPRSFWEIGC